MKPYYCQKLLTFFILTLLLCAPSFSTICLAQTGRENNQIALDYKDVELTDLIKTISELTGRNFVFDERVRGKVTIISPEPMSEEEAYQLFLTVLSVKGFTLVQSDKVNKIVPVQDAKQSNLPTSGKSQGENYITQLVRLEYADAQTLSSTVLLPLISKTSNLSIYEPTNTLILTDSAVNVSRLLTIIKKLDVPTGLDQLEVFSLKQANAEEIAKIANALFNNQPSPRKTRSANTTPQAGQVIAYPRTNTLLAIASADEISLLRNLLKALDTPGSKTRSNINVYPLKNADAEVLAKTLNEIMAGAKKRASAKQSEKDGQALESLAITADKPTNSLLISAEPEDFALIKGVIEKLDIRRNQVYVEALILELSMDATRELGVALQGAVDVGGQSVVLGTSNLNNSAVGLSGSDTVGLGSFLPTGESTVPSLLTQSVKGMMLGGLFNPITITGPDGNKMTVPAISALIQLSQTSKDVNVLSAPRLLTSDNEEAEIIVGSNVPIITSRLTDTGSSGLAQSVTVERKDVALTLRFTPQVIEGNLVRLNVFQEITGVASENDSTGPTLTKRQLRNTVLANDGKTVVLGGLIDTNVQKTEYKVPLLGDIPLLGHLFRSKGTKTEKKNLLVFITPQIIHNASEMAEITLREQATGQRLQSEELRALADQNALVTELVPIEAPVEAPVTHE